MQDQIIKFINEDLLADEPDVEIDAGDELLVEGYLDSLGVMRLIAYIEQEVGLTVPPHHVTLENFSSVAALVSYLESRRAAGAA